MTARLVTIGDSLTQGFQHGAVRRTAWAAPAMVARALHAEPFRAGDFSGDGDGGPLLDLELLLDRLSAACGKQVDLWEVPEALLTLKRTMGRIEEYWERGAGTMPSGTGPLHHNLGAWGFEVLDALNLTDAVCRDNMPPPVNNFIAQLPEHGMYRSARRVLNPAAQPALADLTAPQLAKRLADSEGIENLLVGLGANNALGPCVSLQVRRSTSADLTRYAHQRECNLWEPDHFATLYAKLATEVEAVGAQRVFLATVPHVTIAPVTRGVSPYARAAHQNELVAGYYEYYTRFWTWDRHFDPAKTGHLTRAQAREIDATISLYNDCIRAEAAKRGWPVIDLCALLDALAYRRNAGQPPYRLPAGLVSALAQNPLTSFRVRPDGEVLLDTRYMRIPARSPAADASSDVWRSAFKGGIFGLDGVHPSTTGYGIIAHEVLLAFQKAGVPGADPALLDWPSIVANDSLLTRPPQLLVSLEATLDALFNVLPLDRLVEKLAGHGAEAF